ncbi:hypothetical protein Tco_0052407 [Tanacetum coccineum]
MRKVQSFMPMGSELEVQRLKRADKEKELSEEELQKLLVIVPVEEVYIEALQVKYPIINWEVYSKDTRRDDLVKLWDLVKERFSTTEPTDDKEMELWVELKRLFEPDNDDTLWKLQSTDGLIQRNLMINKMTIKFRGGLLGIKASQVSTAGEELEPESTKKQKVDEDKDIIELQSLMEVIPDEE